MNNFCRGFKSRHLDQSLAVTGISLNRGIMAELVKAVWVHENGEITVDFNFADSYQCIIDYIGNEP